jgi:hypothetical protein
VKKLAKTLFRIAAGFFLFVAVLTVIAVYNKPGPRAPASAGVQPAAAQGSPVPAKEQAFIQAVLAARSAYEEAANDMAKGGTRAARRTAICRVLQGSAAVTGWTGTIDKLSSNSDGKGVLAVRLAEHLTVTTWNNELSDTGDNTLIEPSSPLFATLSAMKEGDAVTFGGRLVLNQVDCAREESLTLEGSLTDPAYIIRFTTVAKP